jgi:hypothetical protein
MTVRVFLLDPGPSAFAVAATVRAELGATSERQPRPRELLFEVEPAREASALAGAVDFLERRQPGWRELAIVERLR